MTAPEDYLKGIEQEARDLYNLGVEIQEKVDAAAYNIRLVAFWVRFWSIGSLLIFGLGLFIYAVQSSR